LLLLLLTAGSKAKTNEQLAAVLRLPKEQTNYEQFKAVVERIEVIKPFRRFRRLTTTPTIKIV